MTADAWDPPAPIGCGIRVPEFPTYVLPGWLLDFVDQTAEATQTPEDLCGCLVLAALATASGGRAVVEVRPGWREPTNLYVAVALEPGERKTPVFQRVTRPLNGAEATMVEDVSKEIAEKRTRRAVAIEAARKAEHEAAKKPSAERDDAMQEAIALALMAEGITVPIEPRLLADDATPEALASLMAEQGGRIAVLADEGDIFELMAGRYSKNAGPNLAIYLKGHPGSPHRVDRKGRPAEFIPAPALTLGVAVQPDVLRTLATRPGFRGRGLLARFLWSLPPSVLGYREPGADPVDEAVTTAYEDNISALVAGLAEWTDPAVLVLTPEANEAVLAHERALEPELRPGGKLRPIADWAAKLVGHSVRLAALLHIAADTTEDALLRPLEADTIEAAWELADYFRQHALAAFDHMHLDAAALALRRVAEWIKSQEGPTFVKRQAYIANRTVAPRVQDLDLLLNALVEANWIRSKEGPEAQPEGGRPPSPTFEINPQLPHAQRAERAKPRP